MKTVVIDYGSGNLRSAAKAFERAARGGCRRVTADPAAVRAAERIVLPGVGAFADCRRGLDRGARHGGSRSTEAVRRQGRPFLGICVGMQLMAEARARVSAAIEGLGWIAGEVVPLAPRDRRSRSRIWAGTSCSLRATHPLLAGIAAGAHAYFVHSYHLRLGDADDLLAGADYGGPVVAVIARDNLVGTQFHPEKSQATGLRLIANFLRLASLRGGPDCHGEHLRREADQVLRHDLDDLCEATETASATAAASAG